MLRSRLWLILILILGVAAASVTAIQAQTCVNSVTVWDNETLSSIAAREKVNVSDLARVNNLQPNARLLIGQVLCLDGLAAAQPGTATATVSPTRTPTASATAAATATATATTQATNVTTTATANPTNAPISFRRGQNATVPAGWRTYTVKPGETLFRISVSFGLTVQSVAAANNIANPAIVYSGETLLIPPSNIAATVVATASATATSATGVTSTPTTPVAPIVATPPSGQNSLPVIGLNPVRLNLADAGTDTITVTGSNYPPNSKIEIYLEKPSFGLKSNVLGTATSDASGNFTFNLTVPKTWANGATITEYIVSVSGYAPGGYWGMNYFVNTTP